MCNGATRMLSDIGHYRFCLNIGWLYTRLVAFNSFSDEEFHLHIMHDDEESPTEESYLLHTNAALSQSIQEFMAMYVSNMFDRLA